MRVQKRVRRTKLFKMSNYLKATTTIIPRILKNSRNAANEKMCSICIRVRYLGKTTDWALGFKISVDDYLKIRNDNRLGIELREIRNSILVLKTKADNICKDLGNKYSNDKFKELFFNKKMIQDGNKTIQSLIIDYCNSKSISIKTKKGYSTLASHLSNFKKNIIINDINSHFLEGFKAYLRTKSLTDPSIGIYFRYLKAIYNYAVEKKYINGESNPFKNFKIQNTNNKKRALSKDILQLIRNYKSDCTNKEKARDFFLFSYFSNGINFKDICLLKFEDINDDTITFVRQKTKNTTSNVIKIEFILKPIHNEIIQRWGNDRQCFQKSEYIFPILNGEKDELKIQNKIDQFIKNTNRYLKLISIELGLNFYITTVFARHSFATVLKNENFSVPIIGEALGHQNLKTTRLYLSKSNRNILNQISEIISLD